MNLTNCLKQLLLPKKFSVSDISDNEVELCEHKVMAVNLTHLPNNAVVIKCPPNQDGCFHADYTKICDYLILSPNDKYMDVCFCELKSNPGKTNKNNAVAQNQHTKPLLHYILAGLKTHFGDKINISDTLREHRIIWIKPTAKKQTTNAEIPGAGTIYNDNKIFMAASLSFDKIIAP